MNQNKAILIKNSSIITKNGTIENKFKEYSLISLSKSSINQLDDFIKRHRELVDDNQKQFITLGFSISELCLCFNNFRNLKNIGNHKKLDENLILIKGINQNNQKSSIIYLSELINEIHSSNIGSCEIIISKHMNYSYPCIKFIVKNLYQKNDVNSYKITSETLHPDIVNSLYKELMY